MGVIRPGGFVADPSAIGDPAIRLDPLEPTFAQPTAEPPIGETDAKQADERRENLHVLEMGLPFAVLGMVVLLIYFFATSVT